MLQEPSASGRYIVSLPGLISNKQIVDWLKVREHRCTHCRRHIHLPAAQLDSCRERHNSQQQLTFWGSCSRALHVDSVTSLPAFRLFEQDAFPDIDFPKVEETAADTPEFSNERISKLGLAFLPPRQTFLDMVGACSFCPSTPVQRSISHEQLAPGECCFSPAPISCLSISCPSIPEGGACITDAQANTIIQLGIANPKRKA